jgi:hypothetical protein
MATWKQLDRFGTAFELKTENLSLNVYWSPKLKNCSYVLIIHMTLPSPYVTVPRNNDEVGLKLNSPDEVSNSEGLFAARKDVLADAMAYCTVLFNNFRVLVGWQSVIDFCGALFTSDMSRVEISERESVTIIQNDVVKFELNYDERFYQYELTLPFNKTQDVWFFDSNNTNTPFKITSQKIKISDRVTLTGDLKLDLRQFSKPIFDDINFLFKTMERAIANASAGDLFQTHKSEKIIRK